MSSGWPDSAGRQDPPNLSDFMNDKVCDRMDGFLMVYIEDLLDHLKSKKLFYSFEERYCVIER